MNISLRRCLISAYSNPISPVSLRRFMQMMKPPSRSFSWRRRVLIPLDRIPAMLKQATLAVEDARFYSHEGIDLVGIARAGEVKHASWGGGGGG